jgi:hypothetical protein
MDPRPGHFYWNELMTHDLAAAKAFYAATCGWTYEEMTVDGMVYTVIKVGDMPAGGMFAMSGEEFAEAPDHWTGYVEVPDCDAAAAAAAKAGGTVIQGPFDITGVGRIALVRDIAGAQIGVIKPAPNPPA